MMSKEIKLIKELIELVEEFQNEEGNNDIQEFSNFVNNKLLQSKKITKTTEFDKNNFKNYKQYAEIEFSTLLTTLNRYAKHYLKKSFQNTEIKTIDEFGFLASLLKNENLSKKDLIHEHLLETSSGSEILKRLVKKGLITETTDIQDRRSILVSLTKKGKNEILNSFNEMHKVSEIIIGNLAETEIKQSLKVLNKLSNFHRHIFDQDRNSQLSNIYEKYISEIQN